MLHDSKIQKILAPTDFEGIAAQFSVMCGDVATLSRSVANMAEHRGYPKTTDISHGTDEAPNEVERKGQGAEAEFERLVAAHPLLALGLAAGAGLLIGAMMRR